MCLGFVAIFVKNVQDTMYYVHKDYLGSMLCLTNSSRTVIEERSFDAWGRGRNYANWTYTGVASSFKFTRGYTTHEHLDKFGLINMNGRVYDPVVGRFLSVDNYVQGNFTQAFNRYSYCLNNPLKHTDPSGWNFQPYEWDGIPGSGGSDLGLGFFDENPTKYSSWKYTPHIAAWKAGEYYYSGGSYYNGLEQTVSFNEVYENLLAPDFMYGYVRVDKYVSATDGKTWDYKGYQFVFKSETNNYAQNVAKSGEDDYAKYGNILGGVNTSGTIAPGGGGAIELGYVVTDKGYQQLVLALGFHFLIEVLEEVFQVQLISLVVQCPSCLQVHLIMQVSIGTIEHVGKIKIGLYEIKF
jgi:RHS repeat-associated protein